MLASTTGGDHYHTARQNSIKYDKNKHASLTKKYILHKIKKKTKARFSGLGDFRNVSVTNIYNNYCHCYYYYIIRLCQLQVHVTQKLGRISKI